MAFLSAMIYACQKTDQFDDTTQYNFIIPEGFPTPGYNFQQKPLNEEAIELGKQLFYEGRLAKDGFTSCGSCHNQIAAFTTYDHDLSHGYNFSHTSRNAPVLFNLVWKDAFQHDGSSSSIEEISLKHLNSVVDMGGPVSEAIARIEPDSMYKRLFKEAYGSERITTDRLLNALKQFTLHIVSANSKYDKVNRGEQTYSIQEQLGYQIFKTKCESCHKEPLFTDFTYRNIGLPANSFLQDKGRMEVTNNSNDSLKFRVPTLRNIMVSSYFTHDGRFSVIRNMINHYRTGVVQSHTLDPLLSNGISLTDAEVESLVSFLRTLTDSTLLTNPRYAHP